MKVTDLEKFAQTHIYNPYKNTLFSYEHIERPVPMTLSNARYHLMNAPEWRELVINRLRGIKPSFPPYIDHELVSYLKQKLGEDYSE